MIKTIYFFLFAIISMPVLSTNTSPQREFRGVWISTVLNIDWPSRNNLSTEEQKNEFISLLDFHKRNGINAVIVQIRPAAESIYKSEIEPWSRWLTGRKGKAPNPYYDPLTFMIEEAHKRCIEFHAWFNPYRAIYNTKYEADFSEFQNKHPNWLINHGNKLLFDPGHPEARNYIVEIVKDVVKRYDIDGVHFDDYFYPNLGNTDFNDSYSFKYYNRGYNEYEKKQWRRENVNLLIKNVSKAIKKEKQWVKFGISPFGIWRNKTKDFRGSNTQGTSCYDNMYADVLSWLKNSWIDYVAPQVYWNIGNKYADYKSITEWWNKNSYGKHVYIGHATYKVKKDSKILAWRNVNQIPQQIDINRGLDDIKGSIFFSSRSVKKNPLGVTDKLRITRFSKKALVPVITAIDSIPPDSPEDLEVIELYNKKILAWNSDKVFEDHMNKPFYYVVYKYDTKEEAHETSNKYIYSIQRENEITLPAKEESRRRKIYFRVSAVDRLHNESTPTEIIKVRLK